MSKSEELLRLERDLNEQPELKEKLNAECKRIAEAKEAQNDGEVMVKAAAALGYTITQEELERLTAAAQELDPDELMNAAGGWDTLPSDENGFKVDEYGHSIHCITVWHCYTVSMHTESRYKDMSCWSDWDCVFISKDYGRAWAYE